MLDLLLYGDDDQADAAVQCLKLMDAAEKQEILEGLSARLLHQENNPDQRWWMIRALAEIPGEYARYLLRTSMSDNDPGVRQCAALGLRKARHPDDTAVLTAAISDPDSLCADLAADSLIVIGEAAAPGLVETYRQGDLLTRQRAVRALALIGRPEERHVFETAARDASDVVRYWGETGLDALRKHQDR
jgi:HEAT repeat protein